jgi:hypothetical protein
MAPWSTDAQVEQDLVNSRAVVGPVAAFAQVRDAFLARLPGGTRKRYVPVDLL